MALAQRGQQAEALARPALALGAQRALGLQGRDATQRKAEHARHAQQQIALVGVERRVQARDEQAPGPVAVPARNREMTAPQAGKVEHLVAGPRLHEGGQRRRRSPEADRGRQGVADDHGARFGVELRSGQRGGCRRRSRRRPDGR